MEVTQRLQPVHDKSYQLFTEIKGRGVELEKVMTATEKRLEGPINEAVIEYFIEQEVVAQKQVETT
jgi:hypothetical protein